jgi:hypothetical protein
MTRFRLFQSVVPVIPKRGNNPFYRPELGLGCCYSRPYVNRAGITSTLRWEKQAAVIPKARSAEPLALWAEVATGATFNPKPHTHRRTASAKLLRSSPHKHSSRFNSPNPQPQQRQPNSHFAHWTLGNALRMPVVAFFSQSRGNTHPPPLSWIRCGAFTLGGSIFQTSPSYVFTK